MPKKRNPKRNHHVLPKLYLQGFVIPGDEPHVWVYKRGESYSPGLGKMTNNPHKESIKTAGMVRDYYADVKPSGEKDFETFENILESLEKPANGIIAKLRATERITDAEREMFSLYLVQMNRRVPNFREGLKTMLPKTIATFEASEELLQKCNLPDTPEARAYLKTILDRIATPPGLESGTHLKVLANVANSQLTAVMCQMNWRFFIAPPGHFFFTGDNPLFLFKWMGLNKPDSEFSFPISSQVALLGSHRRDHGTGFIHGTSQVVKELNRRTASQASRYLYSPEKGEWVVNLLNKGKHRFNLIR